MRRERIMEIVQLGAVLAASLCPAIAPAAAQAEEADRKRSEPTAVVEYKVGRCEGPILLPVKIANKEQLFIMDTGAQTSIIDTNLKYALGAPVGTAKMATAGGAAEAQLFNPPDAAVGPLNLREGGQVACADPETLRRVSGLDVRGVLGMGFLRRHIVQVDCDAEVVRFLPADERERSDWGDAIELRFDEQGKCPLARAGPSTCLKTET